LGSVGGIAAGQQHGIIFFAGHIVRLHQRVGAQGGGAILAQGADNNRGHGEEQGCLVEIVYYTKIFKAGHDSSLLQILNGTA
jgi:hypothetical protein